MASSHEDFKEIGSGLRRRPRNLNPISHNDVSGAGGTNISTITNFAQGITKQSRNRTIGANTYAGGVADVTIL